MKGILDTCFYKMGHFSDSFTVAVVILPNFNSFLKVTVKDPGVVSALALDFRFLFAL